MKQGYSFLTEPLGLKLSEDRIFVLFTAVSPLGHTGRFSINICGINPDLINNYLWNIPASACILVMEISLTRWAFLPLNKSLLKNCFII